MSTRPFEAWVAEARRTLGPDRSGHARTWAEAREVLLDQDPGARGVRPRGAGPGGGGNHGASGSRPGPPDADEADERAVRLARLITGPPPPLDPADAVGALHEALMAADQRRENGAHYTSSVVASTLVRWVCRGWDVDPAATGRALVVHDPAVGGAAFLLAALRLQRGEGVEPALALAGVSGIDVDPVAVEVARTALALWAVSEGVDPSTARAVVAGRVAVGDALTDRPEDPTAHPVDLVVGNPPFLGQLRSATARGAADAAALRERFGGAASGFVDTAALFLLAGLDRVRPGGRVALIQPESVLGARDAGRVREAVAARGDFVGLWTPGEPVFAAAVDVCAIVAERRGVGALPPWFGGVVDGADPKVGAQPAFAFDGAPRPDERRPEVVLAVGVEELRDLGTRPVPPARSWAPLLAAARGVPEVRLDVAVGTVGDLATATAGFRQHFYAVARHLREADPAPGRVAPVLTTGMVDPLRLGWGDVPVRIGGRRWMRPVVDLAAVAADDPAVAAWISARLRPKVVVAPQTRVVEAAVDVDGRFVPGVPLVSVEARDGAEPGWWWLVVAALSAPPVTAWAVAETAGTARGRHALKLAARQVLDVPLPSDRSRWEAAAADLARGAALADVAGELTAAYGIDPDDPLVVWWRDRLPNRVPTTA